MFSRSIIMTQGAIDYSRSIADDSISVIDYSRSITDDSVSVIDYSRSINDTSSQQNDNHM
jgi:hypothetical protein